MQFSSLFLASSFVMRSMLLLTRNTAISNRFASGACLQFFVVIIFCDAAGGATQHIVALALYNF
jgi:hypothetical protein